MEWFNGELSEAISSVKTSKKVLLVFVFGKDEDPSKEFLNALEACADSTKDYLCIKLEASSLGAAQLNAFYPVMVVPLIYIINHDGSALESICGRTTPDEIRAKLSSVESLTKGDGASPEPSTSSEVAKPETPPAASSDAANSSPSAGAVAADSIDGAKAAADVEARRSAAQEQLVEIRRRKEQEEREKEKEKERERREVGQQMTELKRFQREQELKELREEIAKKRKEERETRDRIRRQIEEDRRERMARNAPSSPPSSAAAAPTASASAASAPSTSSPGTTPDGDTRLQFRLPDGSNVVHIFRASAPLSEAFDFITAELNGRLGDFRISSLYPRRLFGPDDMAISLLDLALTPSAALVVMPDARAGDGGSRGAVASSPGGGSLVELAMTPVMLLWGILCSIFAALMALVHRPTPSAATTVATPAAAAAAARSNAQRERRVGGINRLSDLPRDDDDVNTWNGNSTQQK